MAVRVMAMVQRLENLEEIMPDGVFRYGSVLFRRLLDNGGEVATAAVFHEDVENSSVSVDVSVVVSYNVVVVTVLENVRDSRDAEVMCMNDKLFLVWISVQTVFNLVYQVRTMSSMNSVRVD
jgi:uncharacterized alkaline shock family protein YloU